METRPITPCLWYDNEAEEAAKLYTGIFKNAKITNTTYYGKAGFEIHKRPEGSVMTVEFTLNGQTFVGLNAGPLFKFNESISFQVFCETQEEIDHYWTKLTADGGEESMCGWLKDKFGMSWQIVPSILPELMKDPKKAGPVMEAFMEMKKFDIKKLKEAAQ